MNKKSLVISLIVLLLAIGGYTGVNAFKEYYSLDNTKENTYAAKDVEGNIESNDSKSSEESKENEDKESTEKTVEDKKKDNKTSTEETKNKEDVKKGIAYTNEKKEDSNTKKEEPKETSKKVNEPSKKSSGEETKPNTVNKNENLKSENNFLIVNGITGENLFSLSFNDENISVGALTKKLLPQGNYKVKGRGSALFFDSIMGLGSGDHGPSSGWVFMVKKAGEENYVSPSVGAGAYNVQKGDKVLWRYVKG